MKGYEFIVNGFRISTDEVLDEARRDLKRLFLYKDYQMNGHMYIYHFIMKKKKVKLITLKLK